MGKLFTPVQVIDAFKAAMIKALGAVPDTVELAQITRFDDPKAAKGNKACYCQLFTDGHPAGYFGNWRTGHYETWVMGGYSTMSATERHHFRQKIEQAKADRERQREKQQRSAQARAVSLWARRLPPNPQHPYLAEKQVLPGVACQMPASPCLLFPLQDTEGQLWSLQFIAPDGGKKFLSGGRKKGCFIPVQMPDTASNTMICEGWATGQTLAEFYPESRVLAALDAGNLLPVAKAARQKWPESRLLICGDDDRQKEINTGATKAREASIETGAQLALPQWPDNAPDSLTDFNDLANWMKSGGGHGS